MLDLASFPDPLDQSARRGERKRRARGGLGRPGLSSRGYGGSSYIPRTVLETLKFPISKKNCDWMATTSGVCSESCPAPTGKFTLSIDIVVDDISSLTVPTTYPVNSARITPRILLGAVRNDSTSYRAEFGVADQKFRNSEN